MIYHLKINNPCSENWHKMQKVGNHRFCDFCQHEVIDFTNLTNQEIIEFLEKSKDVKICGRLVKDFEVTKKPITKINSIKQIFFGTLLAFPLISNATKTKLPQKYLSLKSKDFITESINNNEYFELSDTLVLTGQVLQTSDNTPLAGCTIKVVGSNKGTQTDIHGNFTLKMDFQKSEKKVELEVIYIGFITSKIIFYREENNLKKTIYLKEDDTTLLGEVIITGKPTIWEKFKKIF